MALVLPAALLAVALLSDVRGCVCDPAKPDTMSARECGLTTVASAMPGDAGVIFVPDINPSKPNRWLAVPHALRHTLTDMTPTERAAFWSAAIGKARELWGDQWAIAINSLEKRTQCQLHAHIGKLLDPSAHSGGTLVNGPEEIPAPTDGAGIWVQPEGGKLRVHPGEPAGELLLMR